MKIGYVCSDVDIPILGHEGCSVKIREFTDALVELGHQVFILCSWVGDGGGEIPKAPIYHVRPRGLDAQAWQLLWEEPTVLNNHLERDLESLLHNYWLQSEGAELVEREQPDLLYECYSLFGYAGANLARRFGLPLVLEVNSPLVQEQAGYNKFPFSRTADALEPEIFRAADAVVAVSDWVRDYVVSRGAHPARVHTFANGVGEHFCRDVSGDAVRARHGLAEKQVLGFVGSFHWWHDVEGLLEAFRLLRPRYPNLRLLLIGHGPTRERATALAAELGLGEDAIFTGNVPHREIPQYVAAMDVAVAPFRSQLAEELYGSPMKLFEYMAVGTPTVSTAIGQVSQIIEDGETGLLYPAEDAEALAAAMARLLDDRDLASHIGEAGQSYVRRQYTWEAIVPRILELVTPPLRAAVS